MVPRSDPREPGVWAPHISYFHGRYYLYYSVSTFGSQRSSIGVAVNATLDPADPKYRWEDQGMVLDSSPDRTPFNAIDAAAFLQLAGAKRARPIIFESVEPGFE